MHDAWHHVLDLTRASGATHQHDVPRLVKEGKGADGAPHVHAALQRLVEVKHLRGLVCLNLRITIDGS